jgi:hypothetical protein
LQLIPAANTRMQQEKAEQLAAIPIAAYACASEHSAKRRHFIA